MTIQSLIHFLCCIHRAKKQSEETRRIEQAAIFELQHIMMMKRKKAMRDLYEKRLNTLQILPARELGFKLVNSQTTRIPYFWWIVAVQFCTLQYEPYYLRCVLTLLV